MPSDQLAVRLEVSRGPLVGPLVGRVVGMAASRGGFRLDALDSTLDVAEALVRRAGEESEADRVTVEVATLPDGIQIVIGDLHGGAAARLVGAVEKAKVAGACKVGWTTQAGAGGEEFLICTIDAPNPPAVLNAERNGSPSVFQGFGPRE